MTNALRALLAFCISAPCLLLAWSYLPISLYAAAATVGVGMLWLSVLRHGNRRVADVAILLLMAGAVWGGLEGIGWGWLLGGAFLALAGWDLSHYTAHLQSSPPSPNEAMLVRRHLLRLAGIGMASWLLAWMALAVEVQINYIGALVLAASGVYLLTRVVGHLRRAGPK